MDVSTEPHVIGEVVSVMVGVVINHDVIIIPEPAVGIVIVVWRNLEIETTDIESIYAAAAETPDMLRAEAAGEASVLPGMVNVIIGIVATGVVSHPAIIFSVDMRSFRMTLLIVVPGPLILFWRTPLLRRLR